MALLPEKSMYPIEISHGKGSHIDHAFVTPSADTMDDTKPNRLCDECLDAWPKYALHRCQYIQYYGGFYPRHIGVSVHDIDADQLKIRDMWFSACLLEKYPAYELAEDVLFRMVCGFDGTKHERSGSGWEMDEGDPDLWSFMEAD